MKSHEFLFGPRQVLRVLLPTLLAIACFVILLRLGDLSGLLPPLRIVDMYTHQARACRTKDPAEILLLGDSTCMLDVDAAGLSQFLPGHPRVLNLALIRSYGFNVYGRLLSDFNASNPGQVRAVVLLAYPAKLLDAGENSDGGELMWRNVLASTFSQKKPDFSFRWLRTDPCGSDLLRQRLFERVIEPPSRGKGAAVYAFPSVIDKYMTVHNGSLINTDFFTNLRQKETHTDWTFSKNAEEECRVLRSLVPAGTRLYIALTPTPAEITDAEELRQKTELLRHWNSVIAADGILTNLPDTLPVIFFSDFAHLNTRGQKIFTEILGRELTAVLNKLQAESAVTTNRLAVPLD